MSDRLIHTELLRDDAGVAHLMGMYLTADGAIYLRDLGATI
jgi:hypothetical protein